MKAMELLRINLHVAHDAFTKTVQDVTQEMADWVPPGVAHPIGERYAHTVVAEDMLVNSIARGAAPWFATTWAGKTGFARMDLNMNSDAARLFRADIAKLHEYAAALFADTEAYLNSLDDAELERAYDMSAIGYGAVPAPAWWSAFVIGHLHDVMGEISALKGCLGSKGYPF